MATLKFDPDNTLAGGLFGMTPKEAVRLGAQLCAAVERAVGADGCHGGVWPGNVTWADGQVAVGPANRQGIADMSPEELEFVSPEQFWSGGSTPASDVYSIGLVLYTALNRGVMPYFKKAEDNGPEERAQALQSRMKGEKLTYPVTAGRAVGDIVLKAMSFRPEERYETPGKLRAALESLPEGSDLPAAVPVVPLTGKEKQRARSYKVDKDFEEIEPPKKSRSRGNAKNRLAALHLDDDSPSKTEQVMRTLVTGHSEDAPAEETPAPEPSKAEATPDTEDAEATKVLPAQPVKASPVKGSPAPEPETLPEPAAPPRGMRQKREAGEVDEEMDAEEFRAGKDDRGNRTAQLIFPLLLIAVVVIALILLMRGCWSSGFLPEGSDATPTPTAGEQIHSPVPETTPAWQAEPEVTPAEAPEETEPPEVTETPRPVAPRYELIQADVTWTQARELAEQQGGHLGTVRNGIQLQQVIDMAEEQGIQFVWLGASRSTEDENWYYVTGEPLDFTDWDTGEPSGTGGNGVREDYLLLWYRPAVGYWSYNDQVNDPVSLLPGSYRGKIAYLVEYNGDQ